MHNLLVEIVVSMKSTFLRCYELTFYDFWRETGKVFSRNLDVVAVMKELIQYILLNRH